MTHLCRDVHPTMKHTEWLAASQPPSGDAPDLREAAQEVIGAFTIAPGVTTGRQAKALEALRLAALAASPPPSGDAPHPGHPTGQWACAESCFTASGDAPLPGDADFDATAIDYRRGSPQIDPPDPPPSGDAPDHASYCDTWGNMGPCSCSAILKAQRQSPPSGDALPTIEEMAGALYQTDPPESWMRTGTDEYRKRAAAMLDFLREDRAALATPAPLDVERLARALRGIDRFEQFYFGALEVNADQFAERLARAYANQEGGEPRDINAAEMARADAERENR